MSTMSKSPYPYNETDSHCVLDHAKPILIDHGHGSISDPAQQTCNWPLKKKKKLKGNFEFQPRWTPVRIK